MKRHAGFTLLELLVALSIFALLAAMAYGGLNTILAARQVTDAQAARLTQWQNTFFWLGRDIEQTVDRPIRDEYGDSQPALVGVEEGEFRLRLTRDGWRNPAGRTRSNLQRVAYGVRDEQLVRSYWNVLDRAQDSRPMENVLLDGVEKLELRFLDEGKNWGAVWPPVTTTAATAATAKAPLPRAVEVTIETKAEGRVTRLFLLPG
jgi:general secretion pathway protein J